MTMPDPQTVREIATEHIRSGRADVGITVELMLIDTILTKHEHGTWCSAVREAIRSREVTGPVDTATAAEAAEIITDFIEHWDRSHEVVSVGLPQLPQLRISHLRAVLDEREQLAARVAELEAERETDVRVVAEVTAASGGTWMATEGAIRQLGRRFADRIAALGQQNDAVASPACLLCNCPGCPQCSTAARTAAFERAIGHKLDGHGAVCFCYLTRQRNGQDDAADGSAR